MGRTCRCGPAFLHPRRPTPRPHTVISLDPAGMASIDLLSWPTVPRIPSRVGRNSNSMTPAAKKLARPTKPRPEQKTLASPLSTSPLRGDAVAQETAAAALPYASPSATTTRVPPLRSSRLVTSAALLPSCCRLPPHRRRRWRRVAATASRRNNLASSSLFLSLYLLTLLILLALYFRVRSLPVAKCAANQYGFSCLQPRTFVLPITNPNMLVGVGQLV